jgi:hypothetical protein
MELVEMEHIQHLYNKGNHSTIKKKIMRKSAEKLLSGKSLESYLSILEIVAFYLLKNT